ncbi:hypothetical protein [Nocardia sp. NRRL S-836]|uniref:hypothetical protein n=1 Tax=Nocardia sp. NRRL S-836 TaxID=1519492 RepID=UPI0006AF99E1|nr:hypothetical protein [Nocardia sp. NRRL S-836]KOV84151.1 hypothetical protein ADL03_18100 [Nocardia sp. NRRL S-836]
MRDTTPPGTPEAAGRTDPDDPPGNVGGADVRPAEEPVEEDGVLLDELPDVWVGVCDWMRLIDDAADWSALRAVWAVSLVLVPALSAAAAAFSAPPRAVWIARSACCIATWPNTPALPEVALMFSLLATLERTWSPRLVILPPSDSTASGSMRLPRPPTPPGDDEGDGVLWLPLSLCELPPW